MFRMWLNYNKVLLLKNYFKCNTFLYACEIHTYQIINKMWYSGQEFQKWETYFAILSHFLNIAHCLLRVLFFLTNTSLPDFFSLPGFFLHMLWCCPTFSSPFLPHGSYDDPVHPSLLHIIPIPSLVLLVWFQLGKRRQAC